ncbi:TnsA endonuclease N-terminal domain-containing protein [Pseudomonas sp. zfem004]|uniref:TnsA endonuclease N-terminal domain-containing protein n=1 Tax=Pseudomonas soli TaxID=1306993 RepID=A0ABU7GUD3_9PSED|nr:MULTISPECIES: TnsA endonuclease N-terminal domain-containing protein [Pseudomonas]MBH3308078.1 Tn7 transposase TnsA N-terminal domain-containing protein [Pseudomonas mosselii]MBH3323218.1 Tn7 transposase TnsA N-terminal domain-containing protein [Pseudomonas mosselii]MBS9759959.1 Tn7 transposase TnsA N-terminal domain-containing protein [Pseudomonas mosselii]MDU9401010.1 TnsA endonuclease N-terminal domain-containing protein [Pseudomonas sp. zfem004]MEE1882652.1 TnsA endonuclease N-terminal
MSKVQAKRPKPVSPRVITQQKIDKRVAAGDGQGVREEYVPWIKVRSFPSRGTSHLVPGVNIQRVHHLLSNAEFHYHVILEHDKSIIDIREQYPLFPQAEIQSIATSLNIRPPVYPGTQVPLVMTTDFLITQLTTDGSERLVARSMKYAKEFHDASPEEKNWILDKLDLERVYWERRNVEWRLVLYERLSQTRIANLLVLRSHAKISPLIANEKNIRKALIAIAAGPTDVMPLKSYLQKLARFLYMEYVGVKSLFFHMLWVGALEMDLSASLISLAEPLSVKVPDVGMADIKVDQHA